MQKARKLIERDNVDFLVGNVNSALAQAMAQVSNEKGVLHIVPGGHTDGITGVNCKWNVFRVCNTTRMEANSICPLLFSTYGKKWHFITPDYAFGHTLYEGCEANLKKLGGTVTGNELTPLGITDFSAYLIKARAANPDVLLVLVQGNDMVNCLKQISQFGIDKQIHVAGTQQELEPVEAMPPEARVGIWMFEWYWKQPGNTPGLDQFIADVRKRSDGKVPTARTWFGYVTIHAYALACEKAKTIEAKAVAKALADLEMPPEIKMQPNKVLFPRRRSSAHAVGLHRRTDAQGRRRSGKPVQGQPHRRRRQRRSTGIGDRLHACRCRPDPVRCAPHFARRRGRK